jgi:CRP/FNR family transcriptional regulator, anaerobic regulatory protein
LALDTLKQFIERYTELPADEWKDISQCFEKKVIKKEEVILEAGAVCKHLYFLESGLLRFYLNKDGNDVTKFFTEAPYFFTS